MQNSSHIWPNVAISNHFPQLRKDEAILIYTSIKPQNVPLTAGGEKKRW